jgi:hypothetical protein
LNDTLDSKYEKYFEPMVKPSDDKVYKKVVFDPHQFTYNPDDKVVIIDGDGSPNFPNLALQKISAWEKRNGVKNVKIIKLNDKRKKGYISIHPDSIDELYEIKDYDRIYASFIFTRNKTMAKQIVGEMTKLEKIIDDKGKKKVLKTNFRLSNIVIGGTGVDEYYEMQEGDFRARPKYITQLHFDIENMYPDHTIYESESADLNKVPKKSKNRLKQYGIIPIEGTWGETSKPVTFVGDIVKKFNEALNSYGIEYGNTYRGSTRGNGYSSKGCSRKCTFCVVPVIQGDIDPMHYGLLGVINWILPRNFFPNMDEIVELYKSNLLQMRPHVFWEAKEDKVTKDVSYKVSRISSFLTISDNNFPADPTCIEKMDYMITNDIAVNLNQGMDARLLTAKERIDKKGIRYPSGTEICEKLSKLFFINFHGTYQQMHFSWDYIGVGRIVIEGISRLVNEYGLKFNNFTVYCLSGFNTTFEEDYMRIMTLKKLKVDPYMMLFRNVDGSEGTKFDGTPQDWRMKHLVRWTNNKILFKATPFEKYDRYMKEALERDSGSYDEEIDNVSRLECFDWLATDYINFA